MRASPASATYPRGVIAVSESDPASFVGVWRSASNGRDLCPSGAFFGAMPAGGGTSQTAVVRAIGGRTQKASLFTAGVSAATMLALAPLLGLLPQAVLAAIVIVYSIGLIQPLEFAAIRKVRTMEFRWALAAFFGVLVFGTLQGIIVAIVLSLLGLSSQAAHPRIHVIGRKRGEDLLRPLSPEHPDDETFEGLLMVRPEGRLFFANAQQVGDRVRELVANNKPSVLVIDLSRVFDIEYSALQMMVDGERRFAQEGSRSGSPALIRTSLTTFEGPALPTALVRIACFPAPKRLSGDISIPPRRSPPWLRKRRPNQRETRRVEPASY